MSSWALLAAADAMNSGSRKNTPMPATRVRTSIRATAPATELDALLRTRPAMEALRTSQRVPDDQRLVQHDEAADPGQARPAAAVEARVEALLGPHDLATRRSERHGDRIAAAHQDALDQGLTAVGEPGLGHGAQSTGPITAGGQLGELGADLALHPLLEALDLAGGVDDRLLARVERVAGGAHVDAQLGRVEPIV